MDQDLDLAAVRAFVAVTDDRYFSEAAVQLGISQQAVSKRIAKLESDLGLRLLFRSRNGAGLTEDGRAFLPHARALVGIADRALEVLRGPRRALRVDVLDTRLPAIELIRDFHQAAGGADIEIVTSVGLRSARATLARGTVDAAFARVSGALEDDLVAVPAFLEKLRLLVGRDHPLAGLPQVTAERLAGMTAWMPGNVAGSEWAEFYDLFGAAFDVRMDTSGPDFGWEHFVEQVATAGRVSVVGGQNRLPWHPAAVQIPIVDPVPVYPCSLIHHRQNRHPVLERLVRHVVARHRPFDPLREWLPEPDRPAMGAPVDLKSG